MRGPRVSAQTWKPTRSPSTRTVVTAHPCLSPRYGEGSAGTNRSSQATAVVRARVADQLAAVELAADGPFAPRSWSVIELVIEDHVGDQHAGPVQLQPADDLTVGPHRETRPARRPRGAVVGTDPEVVLRRTTRHRRRHNGPPDVVPGIGNDRGASIVKGLEQHLHAELAVLTIKLGKA